MDFFDIVFTLQNGFVLPVSHAVDAMQSVVTPGGTLPDPPPK
jgi:hypothetical protein